MPDSFSCMKHENIDVFDQESHVNQVLLAQDSNIEIGQTNFIISEYLHAPPSNCIQFSKTFFNKTKKFMLVPSQSPSHTRGQVCPNKGRMNDVQRI